MNINQKIHYVLDKIKQFKMDTKNSPDENLDRQEYRQKYNIEKNFNFTLTANDIIDGKIPVKVIGCTGLAKLFSFRFHISYNEPNPLPKTFRYLPLYQKIRHKTTKLFKNKIPLPKTYT